MKRFSIFSSLLSSLSATVQRHVQRQSYSASLMGLGRVLLTLLVWFAMLPAMAQDYVEFRVDGDKASIQVDGAKKDAFQIQYQQYALIGTSYSGWVNWDGSKYTVSRNGYRVRLRARSTSDTSLEGVHIKINTDNTTVSGKLIYLQNQNGGDTPLENAFEGLFQSNAKLLSASGLTLPSKVSASCYKNMFNGCSKLTSAPALPAKTLASNCYEGMFQDCSSLTSAPALPATKLANYCYEGMFQNSGITSMPALDVASLPEGCYKNMFNGCTGITSASLGATKLGIQSCYGMFAGCTNLTSLSVRFSDWNESNGATTGWVSGVNKEGTFVYYTDLSPLTKDSDHVPVNFNIERNDLTDLPYLCFTAGANGSKIKLSKSDVSLAGFNGIMYHRSTQGDIKLGRNWHPYDYSDITLNNGEQVYFRAADEGNGALYVNDATYCRFVVSAGSFTATGNLSSLLKRSTSNSMTIPSRAFSKLFMECKGLTVSDLVLPNNTGNYCYENMFQESDITVAPALPATLLRSYCYRRMFKDCKNLRTVPRLAAERMYSVSSKGDTTKYTNCCYGMFQGCSALESVPELLVKELQTNCYREMFDGCSSLMYISVQFSDWNEKQNATTNWVRNVADQGVFFGPEDITEYPILNNSHIPIGWICAAPDFFCITNEGVGDATVQLTANGGVAPISLMYSLDGSSWELFDNGVGATVPADGRLYLRATNAKGHLGTSSSQYYQFNFGATADSTLSLSGNIMSLVDFTCQSVTIPDDYAFCNLFYGATALKDVSELRMPATTLTTGCYYQMFRGCPNIEVAPVLPALTMTDNCYQGMFQGCSSLVTAPELQSTRLAQNCYESMFRGCTSLGVAPHLPATVLKTGCYNNLFNGCSNLHYISVEFTSWDTDCTSNWVYKVADTGTFAHKGLSQDVNASRWPWTNNLFGDGIHIWGGDTYGNDALCFIATADDSKGVNIKITNKSSRTINLQISTKEGLVKIWRNISIAPGKDWVSKDEKGTGFDKVKLTNNGETLFFKARDGYTNASFDGCVFSIVSNNLVDMKGSASTLIKADGSVAPGQNAFRGLFKACEMLRSTPTLPATTVGAGAYANMFEGCINLVSTPELPATNLGSGCYEGMFKGCTGLKSAANLVAETTSDYCYRDMFSGCTSLVKAPDISAQTMASNACQSMFQGCTSLVVAPALEATTLDAYCYQDMFNGCAKLTEVPELNADRLADYCYKDMFNGCTSLTRGPKLASENLATECYNGMFAGCENLTQAPDLNATNLQVGCYQSMFTGCTKLVTAPDLPAVSLNKNYCYANMFDGCEKLNMIKANFEAWNEGGAQNTTSQWVRNVANEGAFICYLDGDRVTFGENNIPNLEDGEKKHWTVINDNLCFEARSKNSTVSLKIPAGFKLLYFETNPMVYDEETKTWVSDAEENRKWKEYVGAQTITLHKIKDRVFFKAGIIDSEGKDGDAQNLNSKKDAYQFSTSKKQYSFSISGSVIASGHVASLLDNFYTRVKSLPEYTFCNLFKDCNGLYIASDLKLEADNIGAHCYESMFEGCDRLTKSPVLPAKVMTEACYKSMFKDCQSLVTPPALNATTLADSCYKSMFENCSAMKKAQSKLAVMTLADGCYWGMFRGCELLNTAPQLPATKMTADCYREMFKECSSLKKAPKLPAKSKNLAVRCYREMFADCEKLQSLNVGFGLETWADKDSTNADGSTYLWVNEWGGKGDRAGNYSAYSFSAPSDLKNAVGKAFDDESDVYFGVSRVPKYWGCQEVPMAMLPNEELQIEPGYSFSSTAALPVVDPEQEYLHIANPGVETTYVLHTPYYATVDKIRVEGTTDESEGTFVITGATVISNSRGNDDKTSTLSSKGGTVYDIIYEVQDPSLGKDITFTLNQGFNGTIFLYGELQTYTDLPSWHYDYKDNKLTMECENGAADIYYMESDVCPFDYDNYEDVDGKKEYVRELDFSSWANQSGFDKRTFWAIAKNPAKDLASLPVKIVFAKYSPIYAGYCLVSDGNADKLAEAVEYANISSNNDHRVKIFVPDGTYQLSEPLMLTGEWISLIGQSVENTRIEGNVQVAETAEDVYMQDFTVTGTLTDQGKKTKSRIKCDNAGLTWNGLDEQERISKVNRNGSTLTISPESQTVDVFLVEMDGDYSIADYKSFYITTDLGTYSTIQVRAANGRGGFGPAFSGDVQDVVIDGSETDITAKLNSSGYATFSYYDDGTKPYLQAKGASAYVATFDGTDITLEQINDDDIIPAETGVILFGRAGQTVKFYTASAPSQDAPDNDLIAAWQAFSDAGVYYLPNNTVTNPNYGKIYALSGNKILRLAETGKIGYNKAYFDLENRHQSGETLASSYRMVFGRWGVDDEDNFEDNTTAVDVIHTSRSSKGAGVYDLQGRKTEAHKGLIIQDGKIVLMK